MRTSIRHHVTGKGRRRRSRIERDPNWRVVMTQSRARILPVWNGGAEGFGDGLPVVLAGLVSRVCL